MCSIRVSTEDQSKYEHSLDKQENSLKKLCAYKEYEIYKVYREERIFAKNISLENDRCYQEFLTENDKYRDGFLG